jgi:dephospho-CoA kinase
MKPDNLYLIGLTGNIACGKSTVLKMLAELGAATLDADHVTHRLQQPGTPVYQEIVATFGSDILTASDGPIDRRKLGARVFNDAAALRLLEQIVHPAVHQEVIAWLHQTAQDAASQVAVIDAIKLLEAGWKQHCDAVWIVTSTTEQQMQRLMHHRNMSEEEARQRIVAQPPQAHKIAQADVIITNTRTLAETRAQVEAAWQKVVQRGTGDDGQ